MDPPALRVLPERRYGYVDWAVARGGVDYHVDIGGHYYSVSCQHARAQVDVRVTRATVEIIQRGQRIASHVLCSVKGRHTTIATHMPAERREVANRSADVLSARAVTEGQRCAGLV